MSTRMIRLFTTGAALALAASLGTAGASLAAPPPAPEGAQPGTQQDAQPGGQQSGQQDGAPQVAEPAVPAAPALPGAASSGKPAKDGTDLSACLDAKCEVAVKDGQEIKIDPRYGVDAIHVGIEGRQVTLTLRSGGTKTVSSTDAAMPDTTMAHNGLTVRPRVAKDGGVILAISHS